MGLSGGYCGQEFQLCGPLLDFVLNIGTRGLLLQGGAGLRG